MNRLAGKVAIITGAARGMGAVTAKLFIEHGATVIIADILDDAGEELANELGHKAHYIHADVSCEADWTKLINASTQLGALTTLVNNAAILHAASIADSNADDYMRVIKVNQLGSYLGIRAAIAPMKQAGGGSIINISSIDGLQAKNGLSAYVSSKWAVRGLTKSAAIELGPYNIRVNTVHPGGIFTAMHGAETNAEPSEQDNAFYQNHALPRVGLPLEVANMSLFLASDESSYSTGAEFLVDGGWQAGLRLNMLPSS
ncbi:3-alpha-(or 20-beta)-hydroxysteroid dehydrogenase [Zhongshania aliphaticivorans]|uniref:3-alpha-(Or 20-beta)-hydroxysteroid dehydrogenase n=1 Tax=Zhongshania aliphaticivorans TaxID=1470434 RepID=A0A5S9P0B7_9GAMM|nr:glucose 1-dehydrogenase [Zhongshania aliphaticivorans]CAA0089719.1 3-alpha-(or 20-beta)-hydroxysteroid dehydrogenase [Zhongshania aliphaticivorans]CAA0096668.1 3-alpha-(or 20-beta)-hydroxysteroid dehydrogenase [Zhongshania aliphaticivorans]